MKIKTIIMLSVVTILIITGYFGYNKYLKLDSGWKSYDDCYRDPNSSIAQGDISQTCVTTDGKKIPKPTENLSKTSVKEQKQMSVVILNEVQGALERYRAINGKYPDSLEQLVPSEMLKTPIIPATNKPYVYKLNLDKSDYIITATFTDGSVANTSSPK